MHRDVGQWAPAAQCPGRQDAQDLHGVLVGHLGDAVLFHRDRRGQVWQVGRLDPSGSVKLIKVASVARPPMVSGVPDATIRPAAMIMMRSARYSASSM